MVRIRIFSARILIGAFLLAVFGCTAADKRVMQPVAPAFPAELNGPYDRDIPEAFVAMLKEAFAKDQEAVPYIFTAIALHFEMGSDDVRSIHFYERAEEAFGERKHPNGAGWAAARKTMVLCDAGRLKDAERLAGAWDRPWRSPAIQAFADYVHGRLALTGRKYQDAMHRFRQAIEHNLLYRQNIDLSLLKRDTELNAGKALIYAYYVPRLSKQTGWIERSPDMTIPDRRGIEQGIGHLKRVLELNEDIRRMKRAGLLPSLHFIAVEADACSLIGLAEGLIGNAAAADLYLNRSLKLSQTAGNPVGEAASLFFLNQIYRSGRNAEEGLKTALRLNALADRHGLRFYQIWSGYLLAQYYADKGDISDALASLRSVVVFSERPGWKSAAAGNPCLLFDSHTAYESMLTLLIRQGDARGGLETADRVRAKELTDLVGAEDIGKNRVESSLIAEGQRIAADMPGIQRRLLRCADGAALGRLTEEMNRAEKEYDHVLSLIRQTNPALHAVISVQAVDSAAVQRRLDENTTLLSCFVTDFRTYVWVMNKDHLHLERLDLARKDLQHLILSFFNALRADDKARVKAFSAEAYDTLLKPVMAFVSGDRLGIIAHDVLHYLPFAALRYRGKYLAEGFSLFYLPHLSALPENAAEKNTRGMKILFYGNPFHSDGGRNGLYAEMEPARIKKRFPDAEIVMGDPDAVLKSKERMDSYDMIHFAAKGQYDPVDPLNSAVSWLPNGRDGERLTAASVFKLHMPGRAVLLSATEAKPDLDATGADIVLFNQAFLYAGGRGVVSSLWPVGGSMKVQFLNSFYVYLEKKNDLADSLQHAQIDWIKKGYAPYYWASFKLMGN